MAGLFKSGLNAIGKGIKTGAKKAALPAAVVGGVGLTGYHGYKGLATQKNRMANNKINNAASGYDRSIARNLRSGSLNQSNLSPQDSQTGQNMYKISSQMSKEAFLGTAAMGLMYMGGMKDKAKEMKKDNQLGQIGRPTQLNGTPATFGIDKKRMGI